MKWSVVIPKKIQIAATLLVLTLIIAFAALSMKRATQTMDQTLMSVYKDRLQPAVDLVYLNENLYAKRLLLETYLAGQSTLSAPAIQDRLNQSTADSYHRISQFEKTKLTKPEAHQLHLFKTNLTTYADVERSVLKLSESGDRQSASHLFQQRGGALFQQEVMALHQLAGIQSRSGQEAVEAAHREAAGVSLNATLLIAVAIIIGLLVHGVVNNTTLVSKWYQPLHLN